MLRDAPIRMVTDCEVRFVPDSDHDELRARQSRRGPASKGSPTKTLVIKDDDSARLDESLPFDFPKGFWKRRREGGS